MENIISHITTPIEEHTGKLLLRLRERNSQYCKLNEDISLSIEELKTDLDNSAWVRVKELIRLLLRKNHIDYTYLYCQGMKDIVKLSTFADNEIIEKDLLSKDDDDF